MKFIWRSAFVLLLIEVILMAACTSDDEPQEVTPKPRVEVVHKYEVGDVVHLKPDSLHVVITARNPFKLKYTYAFDGYHPKHGTQRITGMAHEKLIY